MARKSCYSLFLVLTCCGTFSTILAEGTKENNATTVDEFLKNQIEVINEAVSHDIININRNPTRILCNQTITEHIRIYKKAEGFIYILSFNELLAFHVNDDKEATRHFIGRFAEFNEPVLEMQIEPDLLQNIIVVILRFSRSLHVYVAKNDFERVMNLEAIQKIDTSSPSDRFVLFVNHRKLFLVTYGVKADADNDLTLYKWKTSFFSQESKESVDLPIRSNLFIFENANDPLQPLILSIGFERNATVVIILKLNPSTKRWTKLQSLYFKQDYIEHYVVDRRLYLIGCPMDAQSFCAIYKWISPQFVRYIKINSKVVERIRNINYQHGIIITENFQNGLSFYTSDDIVSTRAGLTWTKPPNTVDYTIYESPVSKQLFFVEFIFTQTSLAINFYAIDVIRSRESSSRSNGKFEDAVGCIGRLKSFLKNRMPQIQASHQIAQNLAKQDTSLNMANKRLLRARSMHLSQSNVNNVKLSYEMPMTGLALQQKVIEANIQVAETRRALSSSPRNFEGRSGTSEVMSNIIVQNLIHTGGNLFDDLLLTTHQNVEVNGDVKLRDLISKKLIVRSNLINDVFIGNILNKTSTKKISGVKIFKGMRVDELETLSLNNVPLKFLEPSDDQNFELAEGFEFQGDINVKHLEVKVLNNFNISALFQHIFLQDERNVIKGNLIIQNTANIDELEVSSIQDIPVGNLMTSDTDQEIKANVAIDKFFVPNLTSKLINNEEMSSNVALTNAVNFIEVPTEFQTLHILQNLNVMDEDNQERVTLSQTIESIQRQVIGTKTSDLSQIYNGQVVIEGSLIVKDVETFSPKTKIFVNDVEVSQNISNNFWRKSLKQEIKSEKFTIESSKTKTSNIVTTLLNGHPIQDFLVSNVKAPRGSVHLRFENAIIEGDTIGFKGNVPSLLFLINQTAVPLRGLPVFVDGSIEFREKISIRHLNSKILNELPIQDFVVSSQQFVDFAAPKVVKEVVTIGELFISDSLTFDSYNNVDIKNFLLEAKRIDQPLELNSLKVKSFGASNLNTEFFESHQFNEFIKTLENQLQPESIKRNLKIVGNVEFSSSLVLNKINNNTSFNELISLLVLKGTPNIEIGGHKSFEDLLVQDELKAKSINDFSLNRLIYQSLSKDSKQILTGEVVVNNLNTKALYTKNINDITWDQLVDKTRLRSPIKGEFQFNDLRVRNLDSRSGSFDFASLIQMIQYPQRREWKSIKANNVESQQTMGQLNRLITQAVYKNGNPQIITGNIRVESNKIFIHSLIKQDGIIMTNALNPVNILELFYDSVKNESDKTQVFTGINQFINPIYADNLRIDPAAFFISNDVNDINILNFNRTIARRSNLITSEKLFSYLQAEEIELRGTINGIPLNSVVFIIKDVTLPSLNFKSLQLTKLNTFMFYEYSLQHFLENRMRKHGGLDQEVIGYVTVDSLILRNNTNMLSINGVQINDLVFQQSDQNQEILGHVTVNGNITFKGPSFVGIINEIDFLDFIRSSVSRYQSHTNEVLQLPAVELKKGLVTKQLINGHRINEILSSDAHTPKVDDLLSSMKSVKSKIANINDIKRTKSARSKRLLYIDYDPQVEINYVGSQRQCSDETIEVSRHNAIVVNKNRESEMTIEMKSVAITIKPNLQCRQGSVSSRFLEIWWTNKNDLQVQKFKGNYSFADEIYDVKFLESKGNEVYMILTAINTSSNTSEIGFLKLDNSRNDWFESQPRLMNLNVQTTSAIVETPLQQFLVVSSFDETSPSDFVMILQFDTSKNQFIENQRRFSGEKFDIILSVNVPSKGLVMKARTFLILAKERGRVLYIYRLKDESQEFVFQRKMPFESEIVEVVVLHITDGPYFIVSLQTGDFCLFEWRGIENWKVKQCGHFTNINRIKSYEYLKRQHLFLASSLKTGTALTVHRQGDFF